MLVKVEKYFLMAGNGEQNIKPWTKKGKWKKRIFYKYKDLRTICDSSKVEELVKELKNQELPVPNHTRKFSGWNVETEGELQITELRKMKVNTLMSICTAEQFVQVMREAASESLSEIN